MAWTIPRTWSSGEIVTAANMNTHVRDNLLAISGAWTSWSPTVNQPGSVTVTNSFSRYSRVGRMITAQFNLLVTGTGTGATPVSLTLPTTAASLSYEVGVGNIRDSSAATNYSATIFLASTTSIDFRYAASGADDNRLGVTGFAVALANADTLRGTFTYEASTD